MDDDEYLELGSDLAFSELEKVDDQILRLPEHLQTVAIIYSAQGIIDNGGLRYFFENDFPDNPPYSVFVEAYKRIGSKGAAKDLLDAVKSFPFEDPHLKDEERNEFIETNYDEKKREVTGWNDSLCGDQRIWDNLAKYIRKNSNLFK